MAADRSGNIQPDFEDAGTGNQAAAAVGRAARDLVRDASAAGPAEAAGRKWRPALAILAVSGRFLERAAASGLGTSADDTSRAPVSAVLGNDDLLREILLRVELPPSLVRASLVCKRWYGLASSPSFLRRFRDRHPPRVLGFYLNLRNRPETFAATRQRFVATPQPAELEPAARRARSDPELDVFNDVCGCWNGCVLTNPSFISSSFCYTARWPLHPTRARVHIPPPPDNTSFYWFDCFPGGGEDDDDASQFFCLLLGMAGARTVADVYKLSEEDGAWVLHSSATTDAADGLDPNSHVVLVGTKICMVSLSIVGNPPKFVMLDLASSAFTLVELPEEEEEEEALGHHSHCQLSRVDDSIYLILVKRLRVNVWTWKMDGASRWSLVDSICLQEMCRRLIEKESVSDAELCMSGVRAELVHLRIDDAVYLLDWKRKTLEKVYDLLGPKNVHVWLADLIPFLMIWPPVFPTIKGCDGP